ncbi:MAG: fatty acid--CoA ligase family protein [Acidobacteriota bacterium]
MPAEDRRLLETVIAGVPALHSHVWIATSGSTGMLKLVALSMEAILASAAAVNLHLAAQSEDRWCLTLPAFHVGGLGIHARAWLGGNDVVELEEWNAPVFARLCDREKLSLSALVPAHVSDLVRGGIRAPGCVRGIVVGGGALDEAQYAQARRLGWNLLPSYGMTECASQAATATLSSLRESAYPELRLLAHLDARAEPDGRIALKGPSLLSGYAWWENGRAVFLDPRVDGWFTSEDIGEVLAGDEGKTLTVRGRRGEMIKVGGELVSLARLDAILTSILREYPNSDAAIVAVPDTRLGAVIHAAVCGLASDEIVARYNDRVLPFERARTVHRVNRIPRTELEKLQRSELLRMVGGSSEE